jgi:hypothetical protein
MIRSLVSKDLFLKGPRIVQIIREIDPIPYDFRERFLKQVRWTFLQKRF